MESQRTGGLKTVDLFSAISLFAENPLGRELIWNFYRANYEQLAEEFPLDTPTLGLMLLEIVRTFEDEFLYQEVIILTFVLNEYLILLYFKLVEFIFNSNSGSDEIARLKALELVSTNIAWLNKKEDELEIAFSPRGTTISSNDRLNTKKSAPKKSLQELLEESNKFVQEYKKKMMAKNL